jgi:chloride channel 7
LISGGASAGAAAAFGAPIGGAMFSYELSKSSELQHFELIWRTFITCSFATLILDILQTLAHSGDFTDLTAMHGSATKFGNAQVEPMPLVYGIPVAVGFGIIGGLAGALFVSVNFRINEVRKRMLTSNWHKPLETAFCVFLSSSLFFLAPYFLEWLNPSNCYEPVIDIDPHIHYKAWCPEGKYDKMGPLFWAAEGEIIRNLMNHKITIDAPELIFFMCIWYAFTITTYGTNVPAGLFLPGIIIGCTLGKLIFLIADEAEWVAYNDSVERNSMETHFMIIASASLMAGYTRMTYSLGIILMETAQAIEVFVPMIITIGIANQVGSLFTRSLYERSARGKQMPILKDRVPKQCEHVTAQQIMSRDLNTLLNVDTVSNVLEAINSGHHGFPVLNHLGNVVGLIPRNFVITLLENRGFYMTLT